MKQLQHSYGRLGDPIAAKGYGQILHSQIRLASIGFVAFLMCLVSACTSAPNADSFGTNSIACIRLEGASVFSFFSGYADTRVVHIPPTLQAAMGIDELLPFVERCFSDGDPAMLEAIRALTLSSG